MDQSETRARAPLSGAGRLVVAILLASAIALMGCLAGVGSATASAAVASPGATGKASRAASRPSALYWGAWIGDQITGREPPWDMQPVTALSGALHKGMSLVEFSSPLVDCQEAPCTAYEFPTSGMQSIRDYGAIPILAWNTASYPYDEADVSDPGYQLRDIISGSLDPEIRAFAVQAAAWGHPFFLRFDWEMNGRWFPWAEGANGNRAGEFVLAWRHVHAIFSEVGATNANWVWCPYSVPGSSYRTLSRLYPGGRYVDWTCLDGYNWGKNPANPQKWHSFEGIFARSYSQITSTIAPGKPMMLGEIASTGSASRKAAWIRQMFRSLPLHFPSIHALVWFDKVDRGVNWPLESAPSTLRAFAAGLRSSPFMGSRYASLSGQKIRPPGRK